MFITAALKTQSILLNTNTHGAVSSLFVFKSFLRVDKGFESGTTDCLFSGGFEGNSLLLHEEKKNRRLHRKADSGGKSYRRCR